MDKICISVDAHACCIGLSDWIAVDFYLTFVNIVNLVLFELV